jgi:hypothetical protein
LEQGVGGGTHVQRRGMGLLHVKSLNVNRGK